MNKILLSAIVLAFLSVGVANAEVAAVPIHTVTPFGATSYSFDYKQGNSLATEVMTYSGGVVSRLAVGDDFPDQSATHVGSVMENIFFPNVTRTFNLVAQANQNGSDSIGGGAISINSFGMTTFSSGAAFDYLAVHFGGAEAFFHFETPITSFNIKSTNGGGLSNFRAYNVSPVPEAEEWAMMMLGLGMMGFVAKRKKALVA